MSYRIRAALMFCGFAGATACATPPLVDEVAEVEMLSRTEFTDRIENFFEYSPLRAGQISEFLIHVTDLSDGSPVADARVRLSIRLPGTQTEVAETEALVGRVTGIYVARLMAPPNAGDYDIEFHLESEGIDETMSLSGFRVE